MSIKLINPHLWSEEEISFVVKHAADGKSSKEIAILMHDAKSDTFRARSADAIYRFLKRQTEKKDSPNKTTFSLRTFWTDEETEYAIQCQKEGFSAGATAEKMNQLEIRKGCAPVTRNAVIGLWHRNKEKLSPKEKITKRTGIKKVLIKKKKEIEKIEKSKFGKFVYPPSLHFVENMDTLVVSQNPENERMTIENLKDGRCKFPFDDPRTENFHYCGEPVNYELGRSYCTFHHRVCYRPIGVNK